MASFAAMTETSKTKKIWTDFERSLLTGQGIDIGCGPDPISPDAVPFDQEHGDANKITEYVKRQFDFVFSSHCLEHMHDPRKAILEWWKLVRPGGVLFIIVPDEDLYEQGCWPLRLNDDHKSTFTISKQKSWSPVSVNVLDLVKSLPDSELISLQLQDHNYDYNLISHGYRRSISKWLRKIVSSVLYSMGLISFEKKLKMRPPVDQTRFLDVDVLAQIQFIVRKK